MRVFTNNIEAKLVDFANSTRGRSEDYYVIHFRLSKLSEAYKSDFQVKIAVNILNDLFRTERAEVCKAQSYDVFLLYHGNDRALINKAIFQLRYLFFDDPLATLPDGRDNKDFCDIYDLNFQWAAFSSFASKMMSDSLNKFMAADISEKPVIPKITPELLADVERQIDGVRLDTCIRMQPICSMNDSKSAKPFFHEIYMNIPSLQEIMSLNFKLTSDKWLFYYLTQKLDEKVLESISITPENYLYMPISLNLNISTVLSPNFAEFCEIAKDFKCQIMIEVSPADVFTDMNALRRAIDLCKDRNHKICLDGLNNDSFIQLQRRKLGFDLVKLQWNADMKGDLTNPENQVLRSSVENSGGNRVILCRCDDISAIEYGHALGISLFQGRFPDRILNPGSKIIN